MIKSCIICGNELTGRQTKLCSNKECHREQRRNIDHNYRQNNREEVLKRKRKNYRKNLEHNREYYQNNQKKISERQRKYRWDNHERILECARGYNRKHYRLSRGLPEDADLHKESSIEIIMREWLQENNIEFIKQYYINLKTLGANRTWVDFFIEPNICLYSDGDYHHGPKKPNIQERDARINRALESGGYKIIRLSETDILNGIRPDLK